MTARLRLDRYDWAGGSEAVLRFGPDGGAVAIVAMPLFEEANRTRAVATAMLRALAERGIGGVLPDLPGQGDSLTPTEAISLPALRDAFAAAVAAHGGAAHVVAIRSGALLGTCALARSRWHLSPQEGGDLVRELTRIKPHEGADARQPADHWHGREPIEIAGNHIPPAFLTSLTADTPAPCAKVPTRLVRLDRDPRPADRHIPGAPPWRRAEPGKDDALAQALADDIADWIDCCGG